MARIRITAQDGKSYMLTVPDGMEPEQAVAEFERDVLGGGPQKASLDTSDVRAAAKGWASKEPEKPGYAGAGDLAKSAGIGVAQGAIGLAGLPGLAEWGGRKLYDMASGSDTAQSTVLPTYGDIKGAVEGVTGEFYEPQSVAGEYARTLGEFAPGMIGPGGLAAKALSVGGGALASETAGQLTKGTAAEPWARAGAGIAGALAPSAFARAITPLPPAAPQAAERTRHIATLDAEGVPMTAGQRTGRQPLKWAESVSNDTPFGGHGAGRIQEQQGEAFTRAALRRVGSDADRATPQVIDEAFTRIGAAFDDFAQGREVRFDAAVADDLRQAADAYFGGVAQSHHVPNVARSLDDFAPAIEALGRGETPIISAAQYSTWRSDLARRARETGDAEARQTLRNMINALDGALERSAPPEVAQAIANARREYRNMLVLEKAATGAGENAANGLISPSQLRNATVVQNRRAYARGDGDFADLARAGEALLKPLPQSGTQPRMVAQGALTMGLGMGINPLAAAVPAVTSRALMSRPVQAYLSNAAVPMRGQPMAGVRGAAVDASAEESPPLRHRSRFVEEEEEKKRLLDILMRRAAADRGQ
jgi:hypothetical protein